MSDLSTMDSSLNTTSSDDSNDNRRQAGDRRDDSSSETLNALTVEKTLLEAELKHVDEGVAEEEGADDELREFQRIERDIRVNELEKCLKDIDREIDALRQRQTSLRHRFVIALIDT